MSDYVSALRQDLVDAAARQQAAGRGARAARPLRPRAWSPVALLGAAAALAAAIVLVVGLRAVTPPRPPDAPKVVGGFHLEAQPRDAVAAGGFVIVADYGGQLLQIDPRTEGLRQIGTTADGALPVSVAEDGRAVWAMTVHTTPGHPRSALLKLNPRSGRRLAEVPITGESRAIAPGAGGIWLETDTRTQQSLHTGAVVRIDPRTGRRTAGFQGDSDAIAASDRFVWTRHGGTVTQRDEHGRVVNRVRGISPALGLEDERSMLADDDGAWVVGQSDGLLYRIESGHVVKRLRVGQLAGAIARTRSAVWVTAMVGTDRYELVRVDPDKGAVTGRVAIGSDLPQTIVPIGKQVWVITEHADVVRVSQG
jgi:ABC-type amino acid transport substrate-binding protein